MAEEITALNLIGGNRQDITLLAGTARGGGLQPGVYKVTSSIASFIALRSSTDAASSVTVANGMQLAIGETNYILVGQRTPALEIQAAAAGAGTLQVFGPL